MTAPNSKDAPGSRGNVKSDTWRGVYFDTTYTRTQVGSVGITRTVRRLLHELQQGLYSEAPLHCVAYHSNGYRLVGSNEIKSPQATTEEVRDSFAARLLRWISESFARRLAFNLLPTLLLYWVWRVQSALTFDALSKDGKPVQFANGDLLLLGDASWCCNAWVAAGLARAEGAKVVLIVYDLIPISQPEYSSSLTTIIFRKWLERMLTCVDGIVCISLATENDLRAYAQRYQLPLPPTNHFRLGCDNTHVTSKPSARDQLKSFLRSDMPCFASVGTFEPRKNYGMLLTVFEQLWAQGHSIRLVILGRPNPDCHTLLQRLKHHPEQGKRLLTVFDGADQELEYVYSHCRALILPSLAEGFGLPLVEARTRGCTVIANDLPSFLELADEGVIFYKENSQEELVNLLVKFTEEEQYRSESICMPPFTWRDSAVQLIQRIDYLFDSPN